MKYFPSIVRVSSLVIFISVVSCVIQSPLFSLQYEQAELSSYEKAQLINFYWNMSRQFMNAHQFDEAIAQVKRIRDLDATHNPQEIQTFIEEAEKGKARFRHAQRAYEQYAEDQQRAARAQKSYATFKHEQDDYLGEDGQGGSVERGISSQLNRTNQVDGPKEEKPRSVVQEKKRAEMQKAEPRIPDDVLQSAVFIAEQQQSKEKRALEEKKVLSRLLAEAMTARNEEKWDEALLKVNQVILLSPEHVQALELRTAIIQERRSSLEASYAKARRNKALTMREKLIDESLSGVEMDEEMVPTPSPEELKQFEKDLEEKRIARAEAKIRDDVRKRVELEEKENLDQMITDVEKSQFYEKFQKYVTEKDQKEKIEKRQVNSFLLRAETLREMGRYEEAAVYLNNVFMVEPYNERAQKLREELERDIVRKEQRVTKESEKLFEEEKRAYEKIREKVRKNKVSYLLNSAEEKYDDRNWLEARKDVQKAMIVDPNNRAAHRLLARIDSKLLIMQEELEKQESLQEGRRSGAMNEAMQEAARAVEIDVVQAKKDTVQVKERVNELIKTAEMKVNEQRDFDGALIDLNKAYALDPGNRTVVESIEKVRSLQGRTMKDASFVSVTDETGTSETKEASSSHIKPLVSFTAKETSADQEPTKDEVYTAGKEILKGAAQKGYKAKIDAYAVNARSYIEQKQFDKARTEIERIFMFDPTNPTAKELLKKITDVEADVRAQSGEGVSSEFSQGLNIEKLKSAVTEETKKQKGMRTEKEVKTEDKQSQEKTVATLLKEGKSLYRQKRYYEALNKFEAVFAIDAENKEASSEIDKVKEVMIKEREKERKKLKEEQTEEVQEKLDMWNREIKVLEAEGRYTEAGILIEKGLLLDPSNEYFKELKQFNEKGEKEQMQRDSSPDSEVKHWVNLGIKEYIQGNYAEAKTYFTKVLERNPQDQKAKNSLIKIEEKLKSLSGAGA